MRLLLDCGSKALAAQDFRHSAQHEAEPAADFIRHLEHTFRIAYGQDHMSSETKDMLLYGQFQEGLHLQLMRAPAVSGAKNYQELIVASKNEEKHLADLKKRQEYARSNVQTPHLTQKQKNPNEHQQSSRPKCPPSLNTPPNQQHPSETTDSKSDKTVVVSHIPPITTFSECNRV